MALARKKRAKRNVHKKKPAKKRATKKRGKKVTKKTSKKKRAKKPGKLRKVPAKDYEVVWDRKHESCHFGHKRGVGGELGSGVNDVIEVYTDGVWMYVMSLNYTEGYACVEAFDGEPGGCAMLCFALPEDIDAMCGKPVEECKPGEVLEAMLKAADG